MKVFAEDLRGDYAITKIAGALKKYAPSTIEFVQDENDADLVVMYVFSQRRRFLRRAQQVVRSGRKYAVVQLCVRSTPNPRTVDWLSLWKKAAVVWSYFDLPVMCEGDGNPLTFPFYHAPLGVDPVFKETETDRKYTIAVGSNRRESIKEVTEAATEPIWILGTGISDEDLAKVYSQCKYVSGLRRIEGFELPVLEGLLCGARPICYDRLHYKYWYGSLVEYIPESEGPLIVENLKKLFIQEPRPVTEEEKQSVREKFDWEKIVRGFWQYV